MAAADEPVSIQAFTIGHKSLMDDSNYLQSDY
jgi:hypothetical protein